MKSVSTYSSFMPSSADMLPLIESSQALESYKWR